MAYLQGFKAALERLTETELRTLCSHPVERWLNGQEASRNYYYAGCG
jgi:hypothetical protein